MSYLPLANSASVDGESAGGIEALDPLPQPTSISITAKPIRIFVIDPHYGADRTGWNKVLPFYVNQTGGRFLSLCVLNE